MEQGSNNAAAMDAQIKPDVEKCVLGTWGKGQTMQQ
jgi:hypothetical protein